jgi:hypothetical protein
MQPLPKARAENIITYLGNHAHGIAKSCCGDGLICTFPSVKGPEGATNDGFSSDGDAVDGAYQIQINASNHHNLLVHNVD